MLGDEPGRLLQGRRRPRQDPGEPPLPDGHQPAQPVSAAQHRRRRARLQLRNHAAGGEGARHAAGGPGRLPAVEVAARNRQVLGLQAAEPGLQRHAARLQRRAAAGPGHLHAGDDGQLQHEPDDVFRGDLRAEPERVRRVHLRPGRHRARVLHHRHPEKRHLQSEHRGPGRPPDDLPRRAEHGHAVLRLQDPQSDAAAVLGERPDPDHADQPDLGQPDYQRASQHDLSGFPQHQRHEGRLGQRDEGRGPSHVEGRVLQQPQQQVAEPEQRGDVRRLQLLERHQQPDRRAVRVRQRGAWRVLVVQPAVPIYRGPLPV